MFIPVFVFVFSAIPRRIPEAHGPGDGAGQSRQRARAVPAADQEPAGHGSRRQHQRRQRRGG